MWSYTDISELKHVEYISGSGTWYLAQEEGTQRLEWVLFTEFRKNDDQDDIRTMRYYFQGHLPPYIYLQPSTAGIGDFISEKMVKLQRCA